MNAKNTPATAPPGQSRDAKREKMLKAVSEDAISRLPLFRRVYAGKASPRECIKAQCFHCTWFSVETIATCTATQCPLWNLRPFQKPQTRKEG